MKNLFIILTLSTFILINFAKVPASNCEKITISGLNPDENYILAVAAFDKSGLLIGDSIGDSTEPILACSTLSLLMNWAFLCQVKIIFYILLTYY